MASFWSSRHLAAVALMAVVVCALLMAAPRGAAAHDPAVANIPTITDAEWAHYRARFVRADGRVVDVEKDGLSHSESQAYGLLLAVAAHDRRSFDTILSFTIRRLQVRQDHLFSWLYDPHVAKRVIDKNNATDADILIAYALLKAAVTWHEPGYIRQAKPIVDDIGRRILKRTGDLVLVRPAAFGFDAATHTDGPVVNLSYYIYGALLMFAELEDGHPWIEAWQSGLRLTEASVTGRARVVPDWITLRHDRFLQPATGFAQRSAYESVRIPLYMAMGGRVPARYFAPFDEAWNLNGNRVPVDYNLAADRPVMDMNDLGYRAIAALTACVARGEPIPVSLQRYRNTTYYSSSLHLLALSTVRTHHAHCMGPAPSTVVVSGGHDGQRAVGSRT